MGIPSAWHGMHRRTQHTLSSTYTAMRDAWRAKAPSSNGMCPCSHPQLVVCVVGVRGHQEVELDVVLLVGQDALLELAACKEVSVQSMMRGSAHARITIVPTMLRDEL